MGKRVGADSVAPAIPDVVFKMALAPPVFPFVDMVVNPLAGEAELPVEDDDEGELLFEAETPPFEFEAPTLELEDDGTVLPLDETTLEDETPFETDAPPFELEGEFPEDGET